jgi:hypothetical protein
VDLIAHIIEDEFDGIQLKGEERRHFWQRTRRCWDEQLVTTILSTVTTLVQLPLRRQVRQTAVRDGAEVPPPIG